VNYCFPKGETYEHGGSVRSARVPREKTRYRTASLWGETTDNPAIAPACVGFNVRYVGAKMSSTNSSRVMGVNVQVAC